MAPDLLTFWGATAAWTCVFKPILEDLAKDVAKGWAKDFASGALKHVLAGKDEWAKATGKAAKEFVEQFEQELVGAGETESVWSATMHQLPEAARRTRQDGRKAQTARLQHEPPSREDGNKGVAAE